MWGMVIAVLVVTMVTPICVGQAKATTAVTGLHVIPFPGTPDASPSTEIIFSSLERSELRSVSVVGSLSGGHDGRLIRLPDHAGAAFVPARPFAAKETVRVSAELSSPAAGTASGDPGATRLNSSFRVAPRTPAGGRLATSSSAVNPTHSARRT